MTAVDYAKMTGAQIRALCRTGGFDGATAGCARGFVQANVVVLERDVADDFERFCRRNPKPCPLLAMTQPGVFEPGDAAPGADLRTDLPRYRVYRHGALIDTPTSLESYWTSNCVAFLIGCSFTFEAALLDAGLPVRHIEDGCNVPMYRTNIACQPAGPFAGPLVVSMRPMTPQQAKQAARITEGFPGAHGGPIAIGDARLPDLQARQAGCTLGINDLSHPDYGDPVTIRPDEVPVFWACGVTPIEAIMHAKPALAVTHEPGHMLVTDMLDQNTSRSLPDTTLPL